MKAHYKFQIDTLIIARNKAVQSSENSIYCGSHVGGKKNAHQLIFPCSMTENSPISLANNSAFVGRDDFKFGTETSCMVL